MKVSDPTGQTWRVSRRWVPWRRRLTGWLPEVFTLGSFDLGIIGLVLFVLIGIPLLVFAALALVEIVVLLVVLPFVLLARLALGRAWVVHARKGCTIWWEADGGSWRASGVRIREVAADIERGVLPVHDVDPRAERKTS